MQAWPVGPDLYYYGTPAGRGPYLLYCVCGKVFMILSRFAKNLFRFRGRFEKDGRCTWRWNIRRHTRKYWTSLTKREVNPLDPSGTVVYCHCKLSPIAMTAEELVFCLVVVISVLFSSVWLATFTPGKFPRLSRKRLYFRPWSEPLAVLTSAPFWSTRSDFTWQANSENVTSEICSS